MPAPIYLREYRPQHMAYDNGGSTVVGGGCSEVLVTDVLNARGFTMKSEAVNDLVQYSQTKLRNDNATGSVQGVTLYVENALASNTTADVLSAVSSSESDDTTRFLVVRGFSAAGTAESIVLDGTSSVSGLRTWFAGGVCVVELRQMLGDAPSIADPMTTADGDITLSVGTQVLGIIPAGRSTATALIDVGFSSSVNDTATITSWQSAPGGITFSRPRNLGEAISFGSILGPGQYATVWVRQSVPKGLMATPGWESVYTVTFSAV